MAAKKKPSLNGRRSNGKFAKGNAGGPGNPLSKLCNQLRSAVLKKATPEQAATLIQSYFDMATDKGEDSMVRIAAGKVWFERTLGKPRPATADPLGIELRPGVDGLVDAARLLAAASLGGGHDPEALNTALAHLRNAFDFEQAREDEQEGA